MKRKPGRIRAALRGRRTSNRWLYLCLAVSWSLVFGGIGQMIWCDPRWGYAALVAGLFVLVFEVGILELARAGWLGMRLGAEAGEQAARAREAQRSGRMP